jgi:hypothetical protein
MSETNQSPQSNPPKLEDLLGELAQARLEIEETRQAMEKMVSDVVKSVSYQALLTCSQAVKTRAAEVDKLIREMGVAIFTDTQNKKPAFGVTVKEFDVTTIKYDKDQARQWILEHAPLLVKVDFAGFEKHALAVSKTIPLDFVTITTVKEPSTEISKDLSKYLPAPVPQAAPVATVEEELAF